MFPGFGGCHLYSLFLTWDQAMKSELSYALPRYGWDVDPPIKPDASGRYACPLPGITKFR